MIESERYGYTGNSDGSLYKGSNGVVMVTSITERFSMHRTPTKQPLSRKSGIMRLGRDRYPDRKAAKGET